MASVRNISEHPLDSRDLGRVVEPDEKVDVPDVLFESLLWPETVWEIVSETTDHKPRARRAPNDKE